MDEYKVTIDQDRYDDLIRYETHLAMLENTIYRNLELRTYSYGDSETIIRNTDQILNVLNAYDHGRFMHKVEILKEEKRKEEERKAEEHKKEEGENDG